MRTDLLALTPDALAALSNRGLVKRAEKDPAPDVTAEADGTVRGRYPDGVETTLPAGAALASAICSCPAAGVCRHVLGLVLAYQRTAATTDAAPAELWSPGAFTDDDLRAALGARPLAAAAKTLKTGFIARVRRGPEPSVDLPSCAVRFLVRGDLGYVHTDAALAKRDEMIALAVFAFRAADETAPDEADIQLSVGGSSAGDAGSGLDRAIALTDDLVREGAANVGASFGGVIVQARTDLDRANLRWPVAALDDLADQLSAYATRHAAYSPARVAALLAELHARHRAVTNGAGLRPRVLGTEERAETPLRRVRLTGLGARVQERGDDRMVDVLLADAATGTVLVLRRAFTEDPVSGHDLGRRRVSGARLSELAAGNVVTESANRSASRLLRIASSQVARTSVTPSRGFWGDLPDSLLVRDYAAALAALADLPPHLVRARVEAEHVRVLAVADVISVGYHPGEQRLDAVITDTQGGLATVSAQYRAASPAALDALAAALSGASGPPRFVSGALRRSKGTLVVDPFAVAVDDGVVVPDFAAGDGSAALQSATPLHADAIAAALDDAAALLADAAHLGLANVPPSFADRAERVQRSLTEVGLGKLAASVGAAARSPEDWVAAQIRLLVTAEVR